MIFPVRKEAQKPSKPELDIHASTPTPRSGDNVEIYCRSNEPGVIVIWTKLNGRKADNVKINGGQLTFHSIRPENNGVYRCEARGYEGFYHKDHFIDVSDDMNNDNVNTKTAMAGSTVVLACETQLDAPVTFTWTKDKGLLPKGIDIHSVRNYYLILVVLY